jgi:hypothetical protein
VREGYVRLGQVILGCYMLLGLGVSVSVKKCYIMINVEI